MGRKVIGIGETTWDILFKNNQPLAAVPGGSVFNGIISLGRMGIATSFISETGNDKVGQLTLDYMRENGVSTDYVSLFPEGASPVSLAFLDDNNDAEYMFYKNYPAQRLEGDFPKVTADDIVMFGSYYAINPVLRQRVSEFLNYAKSQGALLYYDINFRGNHAQEAIRLMPTIMDNFEVADVVRGSIDDFINLYKMDNVEAIYKQKVAFYCNRFICTRGAGAVHLYTPSLTKEYPVPSIQTVSTVGAGDNFNAGFVYGLIKYRVRRSDLDDLSENDWDLLLECGIDFAAEACQHLSNAVSREFAAKY